MCVGNANPKGTTYMNLKGKYGMITHKNSNETVCKIFIMAKQTKTESTGELIENAKNLTLQIDVYSPF